MTNLEIVAAMLSCSIIIILILLLVQLIRE